MNGAPVLREALRSLAPVVEVPGVWEQMHERKRGAKRRALKKVLATSLVMAALALVAFLAFQELRPHPLIVITDETLTDVTGSAAGSDSFDGSQHGGQLVAEGWIKIYGMSADYLIYATVPGGNASDTSTLCTYSLSRGQTQVLADDYDATLPLPRVTDEHAAWVETRPEGNVVVVQNLLTGGSKEYASDPAVLLLTSTALVVEVHGTGFVGLSVYDLAGGAKRDIYQALSPAGGYGYGEGGYLQPATDGQRVVWSAPGERSRDLLSYDLRTDAAAQITIDDADDFMPKVSGDLVTWLRGTQESADVYVLDLGRGQEERVGQGVQTGWTLGGWGPTITTAGPQTDGRYVAWCSTQPPSSQVMLYETRTEKTTNLSGQEQSDGNIQLAAGRLTWLRLGPTDGESHAVTYSPEDDVQGQMLSGDRVEQVYGNRLWVAWFEYSQVGGPADLRVPRGLVVMPVSSMR